MRKCQLSAYLLLVIISQSYTVSASSIGGNKGNCSENEYWSKKGFCCDKCHIGYKLIKHCPGEKMRSHCQRCEEGTYLDTTNFNENCFRCQQCKKPHSNETKPCEATSNRECGCVNGYYKKQISDVPSVWECSRCQDCGPGQIIDRQCSDNKNTQCKCKENHFPDGKNTCKLCVECQPKCEHLCKTSTAPNPIKSVNPTGPADTMPSILLPVCASITVLALTVFMVYEGIRLWRKRSMRALSSQSSSLPSEDQILIITVNQEEKNERVPFTNQPCESKPLGNLPDCVPRETKIHEFFYFVLDEVPIGRFKELVRRLEVSEQNIERAEHDHRNCKDAHYQMLKVWSDSGHGGGNSVLTNEQIQKFIDTLKEMCLVSCADNIENMFLSQNTSVS